METPSAPPERAPIAYLDPGWLFLLTGVVVLACTVLIPAVNDLDEVRLERDRILAIERHRDARITRYRDYLAALDREEPSLVMALAAGQLNQIPQGRTLALQTPDLLSTPLRATIFPALEPPPLVLPEGQRVGSTLERLTTSDSTRPWLIAGGAMCLMIGLLPRAQARALARA